MGSQDEANWSADNPPQSWGDLFGAFLGLFSGGTVVAGPEATAGEVFGAVEEDIRTGWGTGSGDNGGGVDVNRYGSKDPSLGVSNSSRTTPTGGVYRPGTSAWGSAQREREAEEEERTTRKGWLALGLGVLAGVGAGAAAAAASRRRKRR